MNILYLYKQHESISERIRRIEEIRYIEEVKYGDAMEFDGIASLCDILKTYYDKEAEIRMEIEQKMLDR